MENENAKKQRTENSCIVDLPLLCLDLICSYMTGYSLLAVHEAFPLSYSSFLKPLIFEQEEKDKKLWCILEYRNEVRTKGLGVLKEKNYIPAFVASFLFWTNEKNDFLFLIRTISEENFFTNFVSGMFLFFEMFGSSLFKTEYLTEIEKKLEKSKIISCMLERSLFIRN